MPNNCFLVLYKQIIQVENKNVWLRVCVCVCVCVWGGGVGVGGGGTNIPLPPSPPPPPPASYASEYIFTNFR